MGPDGAPTRVTEALDPVASRASGRVGEVLRGKWRLDALLGVGGMAAVYASTHRNGARAAVKLLHAELSASEPVRTRLLREGYLANAVGHEGAVRVLDDDVAEDGSLFLVTELLEGETLEDRRLRSGGRLSEDEVVAVADRILDVLAAAHAHGIVHRDLKPENVFVTAESRVKVLDFGIARLRGLSTPGTATVTGMSMGTPAYMPPEQARGLWAEVDPRTDLWSVGATMFHLLTGKLVHDGRTANEMLLSAMTTAPPSLRMVDAAIGAAVVSVVDRALAFERDARWADARQMQAAVRRAYEVRRGVPLDDEAILRTLGAAADRTPGSTRGEPMPATATADGPMAMPRPAPLRVRRCERAGAASPSRSCRPRSQLLAWQR